MTTDYVRLFVGLVLVGALACGDAEPAADPNGEEELSESSIPSNRERFVGAWSLTTSERRSADGELLAAPDESRVGYIIYDVDGYMGVTLMRPGRVPYADSQPTAEEALRDFGTYASYFGRFSVDDEQQIVTHHLEGSLNPSGAGSDYQRGYQFIGNTLVLSPPAGEDGSQSFLTWERLPDLPETELTETHKRLFGAFQVESVVRHTTDGYPVEADQYETAYLFYARSGHMSVHLMRPGRVAFAGDRPTADEALHATETYGSYFGPFSVNEIAGCISCPGPRDQGYFLHHRVGSENPGQSGSDARRYYELTDSQLILRPPVRTDDEGRQVISVISWTRLGPNGVQ
ncbi:MAG: lipocalin-like domain-containing protein [Acidobacteriota bacterium]|mgnify:CR=1 FL=1|nr:lipocalin-like domain-containing protein [Acidobacteriota bacterium]